MQDNITDREAREKQLFGPKAESSCQMAKPGKIAEPFNQAIKSGEINAPKSS